MSKKLPGFKPVTWISTGAVLLKLLLSLPAFTIIPKRDIPKKKNLLFLEAKAGLFYSRNQDEQGELKLLKIQIPQLGFYVSSSQLMQNPQGHQEIQ